LKRLLRENPDLTLEELRDALGVDCTIQAIHYVLADMGLTYKKRRSGPVSKIAKM
jgi:transposase